ncbi:unnamed protein product [Phyllotreta striolata]|uniref:Uncharacterized protein n=1 Tax=Phyllotreta striolata TaxID=444603 RepID=A0A9N9TUH6_PHYSR|nr:unnamed protein product [Phyllotreta striolata]
MSSNTNPVVSSSNEYDFSYCTSSACMDIFCSSNNRTCSSESRKNSVEVDLLSGQDNDIFTSVGRYSTNFLDETPEPDWPHFDDSENSLIENRNAKHPESNTDVVFKNIEKRFPTNCNNLHLPLKCNGDSNIDNETTGLFENLAKILNHPRTDKETLEAMKLLKDLYRILCDSLSNKEKDDSGRFSWTENDLSKGSVEKVHFDADIAPCPKTAKCPEKEEKKSCLTTEVDSQAKNNALNKNQNIDLKVKVKRDMKKGPLKAVYPVVSMTKNQNFDDAFSKRVINMSTPKQAVRLNPSQTSTPRIVSSKTNSNRSSLQSKPIVSKPIVSRPIVRRNSFTEGRTTNIQIRKRSSSLDKAREVQPASKLKPSSPLRSALRENLNTSGSKFGFRGSNKSVTFGPNKENYF